MNVIVARHSLLSFDLKYSVPLKFWPSYDPEPLPREINNYVQVRRFYTSRQGVVEQIFRRKPEKIGEGTVMFEAHLPNPAVLIIGQSIPITLVIERYSGDVGNIHLDTVELSLSSITTIRVRSHESVNTTKFPLLCGNNLNLRLPMAQRQLVVHPTEMGSNGPVLLPRRFLPSFRTCNITRKYSMIIRLVIRHQISTKSEQVLLTRDVHLSTGVFVNRVPVEGTL